MNEIERYIIKYGKFGAYFYDTNISKDMDLEMVKSHLNRLNKLEVNLNCPHNTFGGKKNCTKCTPKEHKYTI